MNFEKVKSYFPLKNHTSRLLDLEPLTTGDWTDKARHYGIYYIPLSRNQLLKKQLPGNPTRWFDAQGELTDVGVSRLVQAELFALKTALEKTEVLDNIWEPYEVACKKVMSAAPDDPNDCSFLFTLEPLSDNKRDEARRLFLERLELLEPVDTSTNIDLRRALFHRWKKRPESERQAGETYLRSLLQLEESKNDVARFGNWDQTPRP